MLSKVENLKILIRSFACYWKGGLHCFLKQEGRKTWENSFLLTQGGVANSDKDKHRELWNKLLEACSGLGARRFPMAVYGLVWRPDQVFHLSFVGDRGFLKVINQGECLNSLRKRNTGNKANSAGRWTQVWEIIFQQVHALWIKDVHQFSISTWWNTFSLVSYGSKTVFATDLSHIMPKCFYAFLSYYFRRILLLSPPHKVLKPRGLYMDKIIPWGFYLV